MHSNGFDIFFEWLDEEGFSDYPPNQVMAEWTDADYSDFLNEVWGPMPHNIPLAPHTLDFIANSGLSGDISDCFVPSARVQSAEKLARFATLYADHVRIQNPFEKYIDFSKDSPPDRLSDLAKMRLQGDILILYYFRPLFESGLLSFAMRTIPLCEEARIRYWDPFVGTFRAEEEQFRSALTKKVLSECQFTYGNDRAGIWIRVEGPTDYIPDGCYYLHLFSPHTTEQQRMVDLLKHGAKLDESTIQASGALGAVVNPAIDDFFFRSWYSRTLGVSYLTDRYLDRLAPSEDDESKLCSTRLAEVVSHQLPFLIGATMKDLVNLRFQEGKAFEVYRDRVHQMLAEVDIANSDEIVLGQAFNDIVRPELAKIDHSVNTAASRLKSQAKQDAIVGTGLISLGLASGNVVPTATGLASAIIGSNYLTKAAKNLLASRDHENVARSDSFFFLWKAHHIS